MDDVSSETCLVFIKKMNLKRIVWLIIAISYFVLLRSLGKVIKSTLQISCSNQVKIHNTVKIKHMHRVCRVSIKFEVGSQFE